MLAPPALPTGFKLQATARPSSTCERRSRSRIIVTVTESHITPSSLLFLYSAPSTVAVGGTWEWPFASRPVTACTMTQLTLTQHSTALYCTTTCAGAAGAVPAPNVRHPACRSGSPEQTLAPDTHKWAARHNVRRAAHQAKNPRAQTARYGRKVGTQAKHVSADGRNIWCRQVDARAAAGCDRLLPCATTHGARRRPSQQHRPAAGCRRL